MEPTMAAAAAQAEVALLLADGEPSERVLLAARARAAVEGLTVLEVEDGAQAVQVGLQQRPSLALLDVHLARLDGIDAAVTLRELQPQMRLALYTADPDAHRERAREHLLPLFDRLHVGGAIRWLEGQVKALERRRQAPSPRTLSLECSVCGYGIARLEPPERCPMCQGESTWIHRPWSPFGRARALAG